MTTSSPDQKRIQALDARSYKMFQFPADLGAHAMLLVFNKYSYGSRNSIAGTSYSPSQLQSSIMLPLPENLLDNMGFKVNGVELGLSGAMTAGAASGAAGLAKSIANAGSVGDIGNALSAATGASSAESFLKGLGSASAAGFLKEALSAAAPGVQKGLEVGTGYAFNPYQALAFEGVNLRAFTFDWTLSPQSQKESDIIKNIISNIKRNIHPSYANSAGVNNRNTAGRTFLQYPSFLNITILGSPAGHVIRFKPCMVSQFQVNYNGAGETAFLEGGVPAVYKLSMSISEAEIWTKDDFPADNSSSNVAVQQSSASARSGIFS